MEYTQIISNVGFPIAMTIYLMTRFEKKLGENTKVIERVSEVIQKCKR